MKKLAILLVIPMLLFTTSCGKFIEDWDVSPNSPTEVTPALLLTVSQVAMFAQYTSGLARNGAVFTQQIQGTDFQMADVANYILLEGDNVNEWNSIYTDILNESNTLINNTGDNPYYRGMGRVIKAMGLSLASDMWGDIPNTEALMGLEGEAKFNPKFDTQESVYANMIELLNLAIDDFSKAPEDNLALPGGDDLMFGGDVTMWSAAASTLIARYNMRLSKRSATAADDVLAALATGIMSNAGDMNCAFGTNGNEFNTWYAFQQSRPGYIQMHETFVEMLIATDDPRLPFYCAEDDAGGYSGTPNGSVDQTTSKVGPYIATVDAPLPLVTYEEALFLEAEAQFRNSANGDAATAFNAAVIASVEKVTGDVAPADWVADNATETAGSITLDKIITAKYIAQFTMIEAYNDWRRTGIPALTANPAATGNAAIPVRFPTSLDERVANANATVVSDINLPVWWAE